MPDHLPEPWLRGPIPDIDPLLAPVLHALTQAAEDLSEHTSGLTDELIWAKPHGLASLGFHLRHIAGSLDRLRTYLEGGAISHSQLAFLQSESQPGAGRAELLKDILGQIERTSTIIRGLDTGALRDPRLVGRKALPTTVIGLAIHLAEHTQRHVGQAITISQLLKAIA